MSLLTTRRRATLFARRLARLRPARLAANVRLVLMRPVATVLASSFVLWGLMEVLAQMKWPGLVYLFAAALLVGLLAYAGLVPYGGLTIRQRDAWIIGVAATSPLVAILGMGGDPAKPGLEWVFYWPLFLSIIVGALIGWLLHRYVFRGSRGRNAQA